MILLDWYKQWLEIRAEFNHKKIELNREAQTIVEPTVCESCETLRQQLEISNYEKKQLLEKLLEKPEVAPDRLIAPEPQSVRPKVMTWAVRRQMLEREDREKYRAMRDAAKSDSEIDKVDVNELERELKVAEQTREAEAGTK